MRKILPVLFLALGACSESDPLGPLDAAANVDAQAATSDAAADTGSADAGVYDSGNMTDSGPVDTGVADVNMVADTGPVDTGNPDVGMDAGQPADSGQPADAGQTPDAGQMMCPPPANVGRAEAWVRTNPMFISGLVPGMLAPNTAEVLTYYDQFNATATHLWMDGIPAITDGWGAANHPAYRFVAWTTSDATMVGGMGLPLGGHPANAPGRIGYQIGDEPVTMAELSAILAGAQTIRATDPSALTIVNFTVSRATDINAQLAAAGADSNVDVMAYDLYTYNQSHYEALELIRTAALTHGKMYWRYLRSYHDPGDNERPSDSDMRWDAMLGMVYGYTGHTWFLYQVGPPHSAGLQTDLFDVQADYSATPNSYFAQAALLNQEMFNLGRATSQLRSTAVRYIASGALLQPDGTSAWSSGAGNDQFITALTPDNRLHEFLLGYFVDDCGDTYLMVQNTMHTSGQIPSALDRAATLRIDFDFAGAPASLDPTALQVLDHRTATVSDLPTISTGATTAFVELTIQPGDVAFIKYKTTTPFAGYP